MKSLTSAVILVLSFLSVSHLANAEDSNEAHEYSTRAFKSCQKCHDVDAEKPVLSIMATPHAVVADIDSPFGKDQKQCESCHGPSKDHGKNLMDGETRPAPAINFNKPLGLSSTEQRNDACLGCHQEQGHVTQWQGSQHDIAEVACSDCHVLHTQKDPMLDKKAQADVCFSCHTNERVDANRASHHPMKEGTVTCTDCHNVHGSNGPSLLTEFTVNETCYSCHTEKRGPFLWEHEPVSENCMNCHNAHGANNPRLLKLRPPFLCQSCHIMQNHGSHESGLKGSPGGYLSGKSCANCHSSPHGSNHPSGVKRHR
jgi:DmsE family decaheme c-type cytochrome